MSVLIITIIHHHSSLFQGRAPNSCGIAQLLFKYPSLLSTCPAACSERQPGRSVKYLHTCRRRSLEHMCSWRLPSWCIHKSGSSCSLPLHTRLYVSKHGSVGCEKQTGGEDIWQSLSCSWTCFYLFGFPPQLNWPEAPPVLRAEDRNMLQKGLVHSNTNTTYFLTYLRCY